MTFSASRLPADDYFNLWTLTLFRSLPTRIATCPPERQIGFVGDAPVPDREATVERRSEFGRSIAPSTAYGDGFFSGVLLVRRVLRSHEARETLPPRTGVHLLPFSRRVLGEQRESPQIAIGPTEPFQEL